MSLRNIGVVYRKELTDTLRDRRTLITSILIPILMFPVLIFGFGALAIVFFEKATQESPTVMLLGEEHAPALATKLRKDKELQVVPLTQDYVQRINDKKLRTAVNIPENFEANIRNNPGTTQSLTVYHYEGEFRSESAMSDVKRVVREYGKEVVEERLASRKLPKDTIAPFETEKKNVASAEKVTGTILGMMLPYFIIVLCLTGAMYPAMDLTAGEKERGTIETILASPASRLDIVLGKFFLVCLASLVTTALSIASFAFTLLAGADFMLKLSKNLVIAISVKAVAAVFIMVLPLALFFSATLIAISVMARNYREAQSYLGSSIFIVILPAMASFIPGVELNARLALIPILNVTLVAKEIFSGTYPWNYIALIFGSTMVYAAAALYAAVWQFHREEVLFRT